MYFNTFHFGLSSSATGNLYLKDKMSGPKTDTVCSGSIERRRRETFEQTNGAEIQRFSLIDIAAPAAREEAQVGCNGILLVAANI